MKIMTDCGMMNCWEADLAIKWIELQYPGVSAHLKERILLLRNANLSSQSYKCRTEENRIIVEASDRAGFMYGILSLPEGIPEMFCGESFCVPQGISYKEEPYIRKRGIKFNIPLDARTPSYSDASDSAFENIPWVWTKEFWETFLDQMAINRYNVLTLWSLSPFPSMVKIPEFPKTALWDVQRSVIPPKPDMSGKHMYSEDMQEGLYTIKRMSPEDKIEFWRWIMEYAAKRCIDVYLFTWNLFVYGTEGSGYGITDSQRNPVTKEYIYCGVKAMLDTYPLLKGIGITAGENMEKNSGDLKFLRETYGQAIEDYKREHPEREIELIHRLHYSEFQTMERLYENYPAEFSVSFKYSQGHMYSSASPCFFREFIRKNPGRFRYWLTLRDDDYYLYRWGDWEYARQFIKNLPAEQIEGFYMGADGFTWGMDFTSRCQGKEQLYLEKMWFKLRLWGQLAFNPERTAESLCRPIQKRMGITDYMAFSKLWKKASGMISLVNCVHWHDYDFQWYPEGCCRFLHPPIGKLVFADINEFVSCPSMPGTPYLSVMEFCRNGKKSGKDGITPVDVSHQLRHMAEDVIRKLETDWERRTEGTEEYRATLADIRAMALLGMYYSDKLEAAVELCRFRLDPHYEEGKRKCIVLLKRAAGEWSTYSSHAMRIYKPQRLSRLRSYVDFSMFDRAAWLDVEIAEAE